MRHYSTPYRKQCGISKVVLLIGLVIIIAAVYFLMGPEELKKAATLKSAELIGNIAVRSMPDDAAGGFHKIPLEVVQLADNVYQATGIANTHMIVTGDGNVLFDTGIAIQAAKHLRLMKEKSDAPVSHIILSHSHADHIGVWRYSTQYPGRGPRKSGGVGNSPVDVAVYAGARQGGQWRQ